MKQSKLITWLAAASLSVCAAAALTSGVAAQAATGTCTINGITYSYDTETHTAKVKSCTSSATSLTIPGTINPSSADPQLPNAQMTVTEIMSYGLSNRYGNLNYTSVTLPSTLQKIGSYGFSSSKLTSITLPAGVTYVDSAAFIACQKLTTVKINGAAKLGASAFQNCAELTGVELSDSSYTDKYYSAFVNCPKLTKINGYTVLSYQTRNGRPYPVLNPAVSTAIRKHFSRSLNVKFVNDYCTALCNYIVATETDPWMNDALKARRLHDWLIRHTAYEDCNSGESLSDSENHVPSSVFLSYALNVRGEGIGETVCDGYTEAFTMLLSAAEIESYPLQSFDANNIGHSWNLVKIGNRYYEADVTWDDDTDGTLFGTMYTHFLKSSAAMKALHHNRFNSVHSMGCYDEHPLLNTYRVTGDALEAMVESADESFMDSNSDGILDYDFDLDGAFLQGTDWNEYNGMLQFCFGLGSVEYINTRMAEVFYYLCQSHMDYYAYMAAAAPTSVTVHAGETVQFKVTLFGDDLLFQWWSRPRGSTSVWQYAGSDTNTLTLTANSHTNNLEYCCWIGNKNYFNLYTYPVTVTVI